MLEQFPTVTFSDELLPVLRSRPAWAPVNATDRERTELVERNVPGPSGAPDVGIRIYRPKVLAGALPCIFHIHGGGFVPGKAAELEGAHLPLAALAQVGQGAARCGRSGGLGGAVFQQHAAAQLVQLGAAGRWVTPHAVRLFMFKAGMGELLRQLAVGGQDKKPFTVLI